MFELLQSLDEFRNLFKTFEGQFVNVTSKSGEQIVWTKKHMMQRVKKKWNFFTFNIIINITINKMKLFHI